MLSQLPLAGANRYQSSPIPSRRTSSCDHSSPKLWQPSTKANPTTPLTRPNRRPRTSYTPPTRCDLTTRFFPWNQRKFFSLFSTTEIMVKNFESEMNNYNKTKPLTGSPCISEISNPIFFSLFLSFFFSRLTTSVN